MTGRLHEVNGPPRPAHVLKLRPGHDAVHGVAELVEERLGLVMAYVAVDAVAAAEVRNYRDDGLLRRQRIRRVQELATAPDGEMGRVVVFIFPRVQVQVQRPHVVPLRTEVVLDQRIAPSLSPLYLLFHHVNPQHL